MSHHVEPSKRWNLFARELEDCLRTRGRTLSALTSQAGIHPVKINRLRRSLIVPEFHLLSPEDLETVSVIFHLTGKEQLRLRAAILSTAIEATLMDRIDPDNALRAAEEIFPILLDALRARTGRQSGMAATRRETMTEEDMNVLQAVESIFEPVLKRFDQAMLALHLSQQAQAPAERSEQARQAHEDFVTVIGALEVLGTSDKTIRATEEWQLWYQEAQQGKLAASELLG